ncbi:MAG TPA: YihY/virulence factor BrkB family protein [Terracidiphilus sp.]|nr:YihY/virulence factor BrkB family protein [Terracidiphilus sp.]
MLYSGIVSLPRFAANIRKAMWLCFEHDVLNTAKATAYSGMLMLFPAIVVITTVAAIVPEGPSLLGEFRRSFQQFMPSDTIDILQASLQAHRTLSVQLIVYGGGLTLFAGLGTMLSLMEGFRRAYRLPRTEWGFWQRRLRALLLVPIVLVPLALATLALVFGHQIELWMVGTAGRDLRFIVVFFWRMVRWAVAFVTSIAVLGALYHFGTRRTEYWLRVMPGAITATLIWFPATLAFGFYVTRIANYSRFYGSFGAGIATLVWLYIISFSALFGSELNGIYFRQRWERNTRDHISRVVSSRI